VSLIKWASVACYVLCAGYCLWSGIGPGEGRLSAYIMMALLGIPIGLIGFVAIGTMVHIAFNVQGPLWEFLCNWLLQAGLLWLNWSLFWFIVQRLIARSKRTPALR
jgi:hypothetical protein